MQPTFVRLALNIKNEIAKIFNFIFHSPCTAFVRAIVLLSGIFARQGLDVIRQKSSLLLRHFPES